MNSFRGGSFTASVRGSTIDIISRGETLKEWGAAL
jgi:hypothetical protein